MSELGDVTAVLRAFDGRLDEAETKLTQQDAKLSAHDDALAKIDQAQRTMENMLDVFRESLREEFRRLRAGIGTNGTQGR